MKKLFIGIILFLLSLRIVSNESSTITDEWLKKGYFDERAPNGVGFCLTFDKPHFLLRYCGMYDDSITGTYTIKNNKIIEFSDLKITEYRNKPPRKLPSQCQLQKKNTSIFYTEYLICNQGNWIFGNSETRHKPGTILKIDNTEFEILGNTKIETIDDVKIREKPSVNGKAKKYFDVHYFFEIDRKGEPNAEVKAWRDFIPKGQKLYLIAKSPKKERVGKWENYWYYIQFLKSFEPHYGWVYGEFISVK